MEQLAIHGGNPVRKTKIPYGRQWIDEKDAEMVKKTLMSDFITCGPMVEETEKCLTEYTGAKYAVLCNSGTSALHGACLASGIGGGDEVIVTPFTFAASANAILYCGGTPVFADIDPKTYNIDPEKIEAAVTDKTKAVIAVDYAGQAVKIDEIRDICKRHNLIFIEDAAHSIGTKYKGRQVGSLADTTCFSFHPVKTVTSAEGGAVLTDDRDCYRKVLLAHNHGITHDEDMMEEDHAGEPWYYEEIAEGYNYRMTDIQSALLKSQMEKIDNFIARRKQIVSVYNSEFGQMEELFIQEEISESDSCRHLYTIRLDPDRLSCNRKEFYAALMAENIGCQIHYIPVYWFPYYQKRGYKRGLCPNAEMVYENIISIPLFPRMSDDDVADVIHGVRKVVEYYRK